MTDTQKKDAVSSDSKAKPETGKAQDDSAKVETTVQTPETTPVADKERTQEQFEKLLESNKRLFEANEILRQENIKKADTNRQTESIQQPPVQRAADAGIDPNDFVEVDAQGNRVLNEEKLRARVDEISSKASRTEQAIQNYIKTSEQREVERQNKEAFTAFPELDPSSEKFDSGFHNQTRAVIYDSLLNSQDYGGRSLSFKEAADYIKEQRSNGNQALSSQEKVQADAEGADTSSKESVQDAKVQASTDIKGSQPQVRQTTKDDAELARLREATRKGSQEALIERLAHAPHISKEKVQPTS